MVLALASITATPVPLMSYYKNKYKCKAKDFTNAVNYGNQSISLPVHQNLSETKIEYICETIIKLVKKGKK